MKRKAALAREKLATQDMISHIEALVLARSGRLQEARQTSAVAVDIARKAGQRERAALFDVATAVWEAFYGHAAAARQKVTTALDLARGRDVDYAAAFALAVSGDVSRSRALADDLARDYPDDTSVQYMYLPTLRALFSLNAHDAAAAIQTLQTASRFDLGMGGIGDHRVLRQTLSHLRSRPGVPCGATARRGRRRVPADSRSSQHRARRSDGRHGAPAAGESARALGRHREGENAPTTISWRCGRTPTPRSRSSSEARAEYARLP